MFEKLSNVDKLNEAIFQNLQESKLVKNTQGLLSLLNLFMCKYGPEKIDTMIFIEQIKFYSTHQNSKIRKEVLKFFVFVAKWKEDTKSVKQLAQKILKRPQRQLLEAMLLKINDTKEVSYADILEDSGKL